MRIKKYHNKYCKANCGEWRMPSFNKKNNLAIVRIDYNRSIPIRMGHQMKERPITFSQFVWIRQIATTSALSSFFLSILIIHFNIIKIYSRSLSKSCFPTPLIQLKFIRNLTMKWKTYITCWFFCSTCGYFVFIFLWRLRRLLLQFFPMCMLMTWVFTVNSCHWLGDASDAIIYSFSHILLNVIKSLHRHHECL